MVAPPPAPAQRKAERPFDSSLPSSPSANAVDSRPASAQSLLGLPSLSRSSLQPTRPCAFPVPPWPHLLHSPCIESTPATFKIFIYLAVLGLRCGRRDLLVGGSKPLVTAHGMQCPDQGWNPGPQPWECRVLATGPPGKSLPHWLSFLLALGLKCFLCQLFTQFLRPCERLNNAPQRNLLPSWLRQ